MSKEKQIEEMAKVLNECCNRYDENGNFLGNKCSNCEYWCDTNHLCCSYCEKEATAFYNAGYRKQSKGEWSRFEVNCSKGYGQVYYQHKDCDFNATQLFSSPYHYCPNCGAKMKGGE